MEYRFIPGTWPGGVITRGTMGDSIEIAFHIRTSAEAEQKQWRLRAPRRTLVEHGAIVEDFCNDMVTVILSPAAAAGLNCLLSAITSPTAASSTAA